jgi:hypothetical protein
LFKTINEFSERYTSRQYFKAISDTYSIPQAVIQKQASIFWEGLYSYQKGSFSKRIQNRYLPISILKEVLFFIFSLAHSIKRKLPPAEVEIIIDQIESQTEFERFRGVLSQFEKDRSIVITKNENINTDDFNSVFLPDYKKYDRDILIRYFFKEFFKTIPFTIFCSIKLNCNLMELNLHIINQIIKYRSLKYIVKPKISLQERHYSTSAIKRYIFRNELGALTATVQKNIYQIGRNGFYWDYDVFFSLGRKTTIEAKAFGAEILENIPIGSMFMNQLYFNTNDNIEKKDKVDVLFIGINKSQGMDYLDGYESFDKNYYLCFEWFKRLSESYPQLTFGVKHHASLRTEDPKEKAALSLSNIKVINNGLNSYHLACSSICTVTFASTMAYELIGHGIPALMLDPNDESAFFPRIDDFSKEIRCSNYEALEKNFRKIYEDKSQNVQIKANYCLRSEKTSEEISQHLKRILK